MNSSSWRRIHLLLLFSSGVPAVIALTLVWLSPGTIDQSPALRWTLTTVILIAWLAVGLLVRERLVERLRTFTNILGAIREDDYSVRAAGAGSEDPLGEIATELNTLVAQLGERRLERREADALLAKVLEEIEAGIFAFDEQQRLRLVNRRGARWLSRSSSELHGMSARILGIASWLDGETPRIEEMAMPGATGRYEVRRTPFREGGKPHQLLVVHDLSKALAEEERLAWMRLVQVLRHEINNSLAPIRSMAETLRSKFGRTPRPAGWESDLDEGLEVISSRSDSLARLMAAYAELTRLPAPSPEAVDVKNWIERVVALENRLRIDVRGGPDLTIRADAAQLDQALINLLCNAVDAALETAGGVRVHWARSAEAPDLLEVAIEDDGPGLAASDNLFVPFFTTKPGGSGIGLVLSRQIAEAHGGRLSLENRTGVPGCRALLSLPVAGPPDRASA